MNIVPSDHPRRSSYQAGLAVTGGKDQPGVIDLLPEGGTAVPRWASKRYATAYAVRAGPGGPPGHLRGHGSGGLRRYAHDDGTGNGGVADGGVAHAAAACRRRRDGHSEGVCRAPGRAAVAEGTGCPQGPDLHRRLHHAGGRRVLLAGARPAAGGTRLGAGAPAPPVHARRRRFRAAVMGPHVLAISGSRRAERPGPGGRGDRGGQRADSDPGGRPGELAAAPASLRTGAVRHPRGHDHPAAQPWTRTPGVRPRRSRSPTWRSSGGSRRSWTVSSCPRSDRAPPARRPSAAGSG